MLAMQLLAAEVLMSELAESFPPPTGHKYHWSSWADGQIHVCTRGVDFDLTPQRFAIVAWTWADRHGLWLESAVRGDRVWIRFCATKPKHKRGL